MNGDEIFVTFQGIRDNSQSSRLVIIYFSRTFVFVFVSLFTYFIMNIFITFVLLAYDYMKVCLNYS